MRTDTKELKCKDKIKSHLASRMEAITKLWTLYRNGSDESDAEYGTFNEYGLSFDYVEPGTFKGQRRGYFRYQLAWGGPSDEFRFYTDERLQATRIEYWFMDWFDGAKITLRKGKQFNLMVEILEDFRDCGTLKHLIEQANKS